MSTSLSAISLPQLRCFIAVVDAGSFAGAGRHLGMTTSGVSKTIARFEAEIGIKLLHRSTHALSLTDDGERLIDPARQAAQSIAVLEEMVGSAAGGATGRVRISAPTALVRTYLVPALARFIEAHPDILLDIRAGDATIDLADAGVDLALRSGPLEGVPGHVRLPWFRFPWVACASPDYLARLGHPATPDDLASHDLIGFRNTRTGLVEAWRMRGSEAQAAAPTWRTVFDDAEAAWRAAVAGWGIAWAPSWLAAEALRGGDMVEVLGDWREGETVMSILRRDRRLIPSRVAVIVAFLQAEIPPLTETGS